MAITSGFQPEDTGSIPVARSISFHNLLPSDILFIGVVTLFASAVGTMTGFGTSTIMIPILLLQYPLPQTLLLVGIIHWANDIWKMLLFRKGATTKILLRFGIPSILAAFVGARIALATEPVLLLRILGIALIAYTFFLLSAARWRLPSSPTTALVGGALSGLTAGIFGVGGAVRGAFLAAFNFPKETFIFTAGALALITDSARLLTYGAGDVQLPPILWKGMVLFLPLSLCGATLAKRLVSHIPQLCFRKIVALALAFMGLKFLLFP